MSLSIKKYIGESFKELLISGQLLMGIIVGLLPAIAIAMFIISTPNTNFYIKHVSNFYCMLGLLGAVVTTLHMVNRDFTTNAIFMINNTKKNRAKYVIANFFVAFIVAVLFAAIGVGLCVICKAMGVPGELSVTFLAGFFANLVFLIPTYFLLCYFLYLLGGKSGLVYGLLTGALLFAPNIIFNILEGMETGIVKAVIENFPLYFYPIYAGSNPLGVQQYVIGAMSLVLCFGLVLNRSLKYEY